MFDAENSNLASLAALQQWMQASITHPDRQGNSDAGEEGIAEAAKLSAPADVLTRSRSLSAEQRLAIYQRAYAARLLDCLRETFPVLRIALGDALFNDFALAYLEAHPSRSYTLADLGKHFAEYLEATRPPKVADDTAAADWPDFLIDLARLEITLSDVFDGPGSEEWLPLEGERLQEFSPEQLLTAHVRLTPSLRLARFRFGVAGVWSHVKHQATSGEAAEVRVPEPFDCHLAIYRRDYVVRQLELSASAAAFLSGLQSGGTLLAAMQNCEATGFNLATEPIGLWFEEWTKRGIVVAIAQ